VCPRGQSCSTSKPQQKNENKRYENSAVKKIELQLANVVCFPTRRGRVSAFSVSPRCSRGYPGTDGDYLGGNTPEGQNALLSLTTGGFNTVVGYFSLRSDMTGSFNTAVGAGMLLANTADGNTATGAGALLSNTGANNTANGAFALFNNTGDNNTATGDGALEHNTTGGPIRQTASSRSLKPDG
jgi:hypothetical protein